jgi:hypothetical protein
MQQPGYRLVLSKEQSPVDHYTQDVAILTMQLDPYRSWPVLQAVMPNPYSREGMAAEMRYMDYTPTYDDVWSGWYLHMRQMWTMVLIQRSHSQMTLFSKCWVSTTYIFIYVLKIFISIYFH